MHELGILSACVRTVEKIVREKGLGEVEKIVIEVGELSGTVPRYLERCWPAAVCGTILEATQLELVIVPGAVRCGVCGSVFGTDGYDLRCPSCGERSMEILEGKDLVIREIVVLEREGQE